MNIYPKSLVAFQYHKDSYLLNLESTLVSYFDNFLDKSLFFTLTNYEHSEYKELDQYDFDSFDYIFMLDILDPPHYHVNVGKWDDMKIKFKNHLNKTFVVSNLYKNPHFKTIHFDNFLHFVPEFFEEIEFTRNFTKKYLSYNGRPHIHRQVLLNALQKSNLLNDGYVTGRLGESQFLKLEDGVSQKDYLDYNNQIRTNPFYYSTPVNIVTETSISADCIFLTEKTIKAIISKQLIMHLGSPLSYQYLIDVYGLKNYGFDFEPRIADYYFRDKIKYYCSFLKETTLEDLTNIYKEKEEILEYNKNKVLKDFKQISYNLFLTSLKKHHIINL